MTLSQTSFDIFAIDRYFGARESFKSADHHILAVEQVSGHIRYIKPYHIITLVGVGRGFVTLSPSGFDIFVFSRNFGTRDSFKSADNHISDAEQVSCST